MSTTEEDILTVTTPGGEKSVEDVAAKVGQPLSPDERSVLEFIITYLARHTYQPSVRDICGGCGHKSTKTVSALIQGLADKGYLEPDASRARAVRIVGIDITISRSLVPPPLGDRHRRPRPRGAGKTRSHG